MDNRELILIEKVKNGCNESISELTKKHKNTYFKLRNSFSKTISNKLFDAESFLAYPEWFVYKAATTYNPDKGSCFNTWLTITIRGHFLDILKVKRNKILSEPEENSGFNEDEIKYNESFFEKIKHYLEPNLYEAIYYKYECGYRGSEAAKATKCHYETFRHRHNKAIKILRDSLSQDSLFWA